MRVTLEQDKRSSLIYVYLREFDGIIVDTIPGVRCELLSDTNDNWIGFEVFNDQFEEERFELPVLKEQYITKSGELIRLTDERYFVLFNQTVEVSRRVEVSCNIDYNDVNGLMGVEFILLDFNLKLDIFKRFI